MIVAVVILATVCVLLLVVCVLGGIYLLGRPPESNGILELVKARDREVSIVIDALVSDRERLVTAVLAAAGSPGATLLARTDDALARTRAKPMRLADLMRDRDEFDRIIGGVVGEEQRAATEFTDEAGRPISPVGMTGGV